MHDNLPKQVLTSQAHVAQLADRHWQAFYYPTLIRRVVGEEFMHIFSMDQ